MPVDRLNGNRLQRRPLVSKNEDKLINDDNLKFEDNLKKDDNIENDEDLKIMTKSKKEDNQK